MLIPTLEHRCKILQHIASEMEMEILPWIYFGIWYMSPVREEKKETRNALHYNEALKPREFIASMS